MCECLQKIYHGYVCDAFPIYDMQYLGEAMYTSNTAGMWRLQLNMCNFVHNIDTTPIKTQNQI